MSMLIREHEPGSQSYLQIFIHATRVVPQLQSTVRELLYVIRKAKKPKAAVGQFPCTGFPIVAASLVVWSELSVKQDHLMWLALHI